MERNLRLFLAPFAVDSLELEARRQRVPFGVLLRHAALHYFAECSSGRLAISVPSFTGQEREGEPVAVGVDLDGGAWRRLENAAAVECVSVATLMQHAAMLYVADADSGRVRTRLLGV